MNTFYAFCRLVDDIADHPELEKSEKARLLGIWSDSLEGPRPEESRMAPAIRELCDRRRIDLDLLREIVVGVKADISVRRYETFEALRTYCYRVASVVGLVSIEIFGYRNPRSREYAVELGLALQLTNILRDVGEDWANDGRIYLPGEDLARFGYSEDKLAAGLRDAAFLELMNFEAERAESYYRRASELLPAEDRFSMAAAQLMREVYHRILIKMKADGFQVFEKRYALGTVAKTWLLLSHSTGVVAGRLFGRGRTR